MDALYDHVVVYKALSIVDADGAMGEMVEGGLHPVALDYPNVVMRTITRGMIRIRIAVPSDEAEQAEALLEAWHERTEPAARDLARQFERQAGIFLLVAGVLAIPIWFAIRRWPDLPWGWMIAAAVVTVFAAIHVIGHRGDPGDSGTP